MDANDVKNAAKSAFSLKYLVAFVVAMVLISAIADALGVWDWVFRPFLKGKAYAQSKGWIKAGAN